MEVRNSYSLMHSRAKIVMTHLKHKIFTTRAFSTHIIKAKSEIIQKIYNKYFNPFKDFNLT